MDFGMLDLMRTIIPDVDNEEKAEDCVTTVRAVCLFPLLLGGFFAGLGILGTAVEFVLWARGSSFQLLPPIMAASGTAAYLFGAWMRRALVAHDRRAWYVHAVLGAIVSMLLAGPPVVGIVWCVRTRDYAFAFVLISTMGPIVYGAFRLHRGWLTPHVRRLFGVTPQAQTADPGIST